MCLRTTSLSFIGILSTTCSAAYADCLSKNPELYDYSGAYTGATRTTSLELVSPSGSKICELKSAEEIKELGGEILFKVIKGKGGPRSSFLTAKCQNLLVNFYKSQPSGNVTEMGKGFDTRLRVIAVGAPPENVIDAAPNGWSHTRKEQGFGTVSYDAVDIKSKCIKGGEWLTIDRKFKALTTKGEILQTRQIMFKWINSNN